MKENLFADVQDKQEIKPDSNYDRLLKNRQRPELPLEDGEAGFTNEKNPVSSPKKEIPEMKKLDPDFVRKQATAYFNGDDWLPTCG